MTETGRGGGSPLRTDRGTTTISSAVVSSIASKVVEEVSGAEPAIGGRGTTLPGDNSPTVGEFLGGLTSSGNRSRGVSVEVGDAQAAVDLTVTVPYGRSVPEITQRMRETAIRRIESLTGLEVTEVNITVRDVFLPQQQQQQ